MRELSAQQTRELVGIVGEDAFPKVESFLIRLRIQDATEFHSRSLSTIDQTVTRYLACPDRSPRYQVQDAIRRSFESMDLTNFER
jgi:hypothetical protein